MRIILALIYELGFIGFIFIGLCLFFLVIVFGSAAGGIYAWIGVFILIGYIWISYLFRKKIQGVFLIKLNNKLRDLKATHGFVSDVQIWGGGNTSFLGFDASEKLGVFLNYAPEIQRTFHFEDILGCNWTESDTNISFEISLKEGKININILRGEFYDFKNRMFAITGMNG